MALFPFYSYDLISCLDRKSLVTIASPSGWFFLLFFFLFFLLPFQLIIFSSRSATSQLEAHKSLPSCGHDRSEEVEASIPEPFSPKKGAIPP